VVGSGGDAAAMSGAVEVHGHGAVALSASPRRFSSASSVGSRPRNAV
jgi:hypothetical protein